MRKIYKDNGLPFYESDELRDRQYLCTLLADSIKELLLERNEAWKFYQIEASALIPRTLVSAEYGSDDIYLTQDFALRPETTPASYAYGADLIKHQETTPPFCVWQLAKSFRRENDQVSSNVRLKEFYQQEFQCIFTADTMNDYQIILPYVAKIVSKFTGLKTRIVTSDRLPHYSEKTLDIEVKTTHKWLEICSSSRRTDVPFSWNERKLLNIEFAFGIDRILYARNEAS